MFITPSLRAQRGNLFGPGAKLKEIAALRSQ